MIRFSIFSTVDGCGGFFRWRHSSICSNKVRQPSTNIRIGHVLIRIESLQTISKYVQRSEIRFHILVIHLFFQIHTKLQNYTISKIMHGIPHHNLLSHVYDLHHTIRGCQKICVKTKVGFLQAFNCNRIYSRLNE